MKKFMYIVAIISIFTLTGCNFFSNKKNNSLKDAEIVLINVLDKDLFDDCHIKGSINIPFETIETCDGIIDKNAEIVCYCSNYFCTASGEAARILKKRGFKNVFAYEGGTAEWIQQGYPVEGPSKSGYLKKIVEPHTQDSDVAIITTEELACKMGLLSKK